MEQIMISSEYLEMKMPYTFNQYFKIVGIAKLLVIHKECTIWITNNRTYYLLAGKKIIFTSPDVEPIKFVFNDYFNGVIEENK